MIYRQSALYYHVSVYIRNQAIRQNQCLDGVEHGREIPVGTLTDSASAVVSNPVSEISRLRSGFRGLL